MLKEFSNENFKVDRHIKSWAMVIRVLGFVFMGLCAVVSLILLGINAEWLWGVSLCVLAFGGIVVFSSCFFSVMVYGFGDLVANAQKIAKGTEFSDIDKGEIKLPEL